MGSEWLALLMFAGFFFILLSGYPVAYSFVATSIIFGLLGLALGEFNLNRLLLLPNVWFGTMSNFTLLAIPFFVFLGTVFEKSGLAQELLETVGVLLGPLRGGLALTVVVVGTLLAATTGVVAATIIVMGMLSLPTMLKYGYDKQLASGVIIASGTLAQMIPPSLVLVVLSDQIGVGVGDLFAGALIPGLMMTASYAIYVIIVAWLRPGAAPALPPEARTLRGAELYRRVVRSVLLPGFLVFSVLGSIFFGIATPTEAGGIGALGACLLSAFNGRLSWQVLKDSAAATARLTALVVNILFCSSLFSLVFDELGGKRLVTDLLVALGSQNGVIAYMIIANIVIFLLGIFLEFTEISFIAMPLLVPAAVALGIPLAWFGVVMAINLQTAFVSPPVGFSLFYLQTVAPKEISTLDIHRSALPFMGLQLLVLVLVIAFPETVTWLVDVFNQVR